MGLIEINRWFFQRLKPPFMVGIFHGELLVITRWYFQSARHLRSEGSQLFTVLFSFCKDAKQQPDSDWLVDDFQPLNKNHAVFNHHPILLNKLVIFEIKSCWHTEKYPMYCHFDPFLLLHCYFKQPFGCQKRTPASARLAAVFASNPDVGSSKSSTGASRINARANATRCLSPPDLMAVMIWGVAKRDCQVRHQSIGFKFANSWVSKCPHVSHHPTIRFH